MDHMKGLLQAKRHEEAYQFAAALLADHPRHPGLLSIAASAAYSLGRFQEAKELLERALEVQPDSRALSDSLERVVKKMGG